MKTLTIAFVLAAGVAAAPFATQSGGLTGVFGNWSAVNDGGAAVRVDGAAWNGVTDTIALAAVARRLFGSPAPDFVKNNAGSASLPIAVHEPTPTFAGGTLRVKFKLVGGASDQYAGVMFGLKPDGSYQYIRYNTKDGNVALWKYENGARTVVKHGDVHVQLPLGSWQELVVSVTGTTARGWIAGQDSIRVEHTLSGPLSGRVGVQVKRDAITHFRDFQATPAR
jgi:hypothetical protein